MSFVIMQHRGAEHKSVMASLLKKYTKLEVIEIEDGTKIRAECVYLNPPHTDVTITNRKLYCSEPAQAFGTRLPIDHFFRSLAHDEGERSICIILSGTGTDGTLGMKDIKAVGGMAMVQEEKQAKYPTMPRNAIDTGLVDFVLPVEMMPQELMRYIKHPYIKQIRKPVAAAEKFENALQQIFMLVRTRTGHDFAGYKRNTIRRRIERRMAVHQIAMIDEYVRFLREHSDEVKTLFKDLIITVTNFFRDPESFEALKEKAITNIIKDKAFDSPLRIWIPGCATGEEAYSIAMLCEETKEELQKHLDVQVFGTDVDDQSIEVARRGNYPGNIAADVSEKRLKRFFNKVDARYKVKESIRDNLIFAAQDLIKDPPFSKLDLVCCRNVLIYMGTELQKKIIPIFHYTLNPDGYLFLGTSETIGSFSDLFSPVDTKNKIYRRKTGAIDRNAEYPLIPLQVSQQTPEREPRQIRRQANIPRLVEKLILRDYSLPCVLIDEKFDIIYYNGDTSIFLRQPGGEPTTNILKMARPELRNLLTILLHKAENNRTSVREKNVQLQINNKCLTFDLLVRAVDELGADNKLLMVVFEIKEQPAKSSEEAKDSAKTTPVEPRVRSLEQELASTKEYLQTTIEELETSNEELKSSNEELQSSNEELQSTNEELETSREELQSTNEELQTVNSSHQKKIDELSDANDDLDNLLSSSEIATVFLDNDLNIKRFTKTAKRLFKVIESDVGRPLGDIVSDLKYDQLHENAKHVLETLEEVEKEVECLNNQWFFMRIIPYRTLQNIINGVVITFSEITPQKVAEFTARRSQAFAEGIVETVNHPLIVLDKDLRIVSANRAFYKTFKTTQQTTLGKFIYEIGNRQWDIPHLRELLEKILPEKGEFENFIIDHKFSEIGKKKILLNARQVEYDEEGVGTILLAIEEISNE